MKQWRLERDIQDKQNNYGQIYHLVDEKNSKKIKICEEFQLNLLFFISFDVTDKCSAWRHLHWFLCPLAGDERARSFPVARLTDN